MVLNYQYHFYTRTPLPKVEAKKNLRKHFSQPPKEKNKKKNKKKNRDDGGRITQKTKKNMAKSYHILKNIKKMRRIRRRKHFPHPPKDEEQEVEERRMWKTCQ